MNRGGLAVRIGRIYQRISPLWAFLDYPFRLNSKSKSAAKIFILAAPRSGSTLSYQILTSGIDCVYLTNFSNLLYSNPALAFRLTERKCKERLSSFSSKNGFVAGLFGEAEGLKFWNYWAGCNLIESKVDHNEKRVLHLRKAMNASTDTLISGFIGHVFSINFLKNAFPNAIFIHLKRDILSNVYSLYNYKRSTGNQSALPKDIDLSSPLEMQLTQQISTIHKKIELAKQEGLRCIEITYHDICKSPHKEINRIIEFAKSNEIKIEKSITYAKIPKKFKASIVDVEKDSLSQKIQKCIEQLNLQKIDPQ